MTLDERELVRRACDGDPAAVRTLYERHAARVFAVIRRIAGDDELARDWAQEAWIRALRALPAWRGEARLSTWLHRLAVNAALQALRAHRSRDRREVVLDPDVERTPAPAASAPDAGDPLLRDRLEAALDALPPGMREVLVLHDVEGYTHGEISGALGIDPGTSKSQLFKARARMRSLLGALHGPDEELEACAT